jgi:hypothetical protein
LATGNASVADLRRAGVAVHLGELELGFGADSRRQGRVADDIAKCLPEKVLEIASDDLMDAQRRPVTMQGFGNVC